jgi:hypothetical protein
MKTTRVKPNPVVCGALLYQWVENNDFDATREFAKKCGYQSYHIYHRIYVGVWRLTSLQLDKKDYPSVRVLLEQNREKIIESLNNDAR